LLLVQDLQLLLLLVLAVQPARHHKVVTEEIVFLDL
jgi:hypothetical protein